MIKAHARDILVSGPTHVSTRGEATDLKNIVRLVALTATLVTFFLTWAFCISHFGVTNGLRLGWIPAAVVGAAVGWISGRTSTIVPLVIMATGLALAVAT